MLASRILGLVPLMARTASFNFLTSNGLTFPIDLAVNGGPFPLFPGKLGLVALSRLVLETRTGVATGNLSLTIGNNVAVDNIISASTQITAAQFNTASPAAVPLSVGSISAGGLVDMGTIAKIKIATVPAGATVLSGYFAMAVWPV